MSTFTGKDILVLIDAKDLERENPGFFEYADCREATSKDSPDHTKTDPGDSTTAISSCYDPKKHLFFDYESYGNPDKISNDNILIRLSAIHAKVDVASYYDECCVKVIAVESRENTKTDFINIDKSGERIIYYPNWRSLFWDDNPDGQDTFRYFIENVETGEIASGNITIQSYAYSIKELFTEDIYINLKAPLPAIIEVDTKVFNPLYPGAILDHVGHFDKKFFNAIDISPDNKSGLIFSLDKEKCNWDCCGVETYVEYWLKKDGFSTRGRIYFRKDCDDFEVNDIVIEIEGDVPEFLEINVQDYNTHAGISLYQVQQVPSNRGSSEIVEGTNEDLLKYVFNKNSSFWKETLQQEVFYYTARRDDGEFATAYIWIKKASSSSSSGGILPVQQSLNIIGGTLTKTSQGVASHFTGTLDVDYGGNEISILVELDAIQDNTTLWPLRCTFNGQSGSDLIQVNGSFNYEVPSINVSSIPVGNSLTVIGGEITMAG